MHVAVVDHGLQDGSAERSAALVAGLTAQGVPAAVHTVVVDGPGGVEAAARRARYAALRAARPHPDSAVLLGHTLDDQAETVLLGLGRGSGARSLAGMTTWDPPWLRPLLGLRRADTAAACRAQGLPFWDDPHNADPRFTRVRLRHEVLPLLEEVLGGGVAEALARTAAQLRDDGEALDAAAHDLLARACRNAEDTVQERATRDDALDAGALDADVLGAAPPAVRRRALRAWLSDPRSHRAHRPAPARRRRSRRPLARSGGGRAAAAVGAGSRAWEASRAHGGVAGRPMRYPRPPWSTPPVRNPRRPLRVRRGHRIRADHRGRDPREDRGARRGGRQGLRGPLLGTGTTCCSSASSRAR